MAAKYDSFRSSDEDQNESEADVVTVSDSGSDNDASVDELNEIARQNKEFEQLKSQRNEFGFENLSSVENPRKRKKPAIKKRKSGKKSKRQPTSQLRIQTQRKRQLRRSTTLVRRKVLPLANHPPPILPKSATGSQNRFPKPITSWNISRSMPMPMALT